MAGLYSHGGVGYKIAVKVLCFQTVLQLFVRETLVTNEFTPIRRWEMRPMAAREWGLEPVLVRALALALAIRDQAPPCAWRTVHGRCGWFRARYRCRRR